MSEIERAEFYELDRNDSLSSYKDKFSIPKNVIYLNGNSLGAMPFSALERMKKIMEEEWGRDMIKSWNSAGWYNSPQRIGDKIAKIIGTDDGEVVCVDATGVNLFKTLVAASELNAGRKYIVLEGSNFPTNNYVTQGVLKLLKNQYEIRFVERENMFESIDNDVSIVCLTHVHYRTGYVHDMEKINRHAHKMGALTIWDLSHSAGILPLTLNKHKVDFAVGCTYKYLNGGPGSPAFVFCAKRHHGKVSQPLTGWWGHKYPFEFSRDYVPADGIRQFQTGTQPIVSMLLAEKGIDIALDVDMNDAIRKSREMGDMFIHQIEGRLSKYGFTIGSPRTSACRGGHVSIEHENGYAIIQALQNQNVIADYRAPNTMRFAFSPLYVRFMDIFNTVKILEDIMEHKKWDHEKHLHRSFVT